MLSAAIESTTPDAEDWRAYIGHYKAYFINGSKILVLSPHIAAKAIHSLAFPGVR
jgi:hypothetical protein